MASKATKKLWRKSLGSNSSKSSSVLTKKAKKREEIELKSDSILHFDEEGEAFSVQTETETPVAPPTSLLGKQASVSLQPGTPLSRSESHNNTNNYYAGTPEARGGSGSYALPPFPTAPTSPSPMVSRTLPSPPSPTSHALRGGRGGASPPGRGGRGGGGTIAPSPHVAGEGGGGPVRGGIGGTGGRGGVNGGRGGLPPMPLPRGGGGAGSGMARGGGGAGGEGGRGGGPVVASAIRGRGGLRGGAGALGRGPSSPDLRRSADVTTSMKLQQMGTVVGGGGRGGSVILRGAGGPGSPLSRSMGRGGGGGATNEGGDINGLEQQADANNCTAAQTTAERSNGSVGGGGGSGRVLKRVKSVPSSLPSVLKHPTEEQQQGGRSDSQSQPDRDTQFLQREEKIQMMKARLKKVTTACEKYNREGLKVAKEMQALGQQLEKMSSSESKRDCESVYAQALLQFGPSIKEASSAQTKLHDTTPELFITPILRLIEKDINTELKAVESKYKKARNNYDTQVSKVAALRAKAKIDVVRLYEAEKELKKAKLAYEEAIEEAFYKLEDLELSKNSDVLEWFIALLQAEKERYGQDYALFHHIENYMRDIHQWCVDSGKHFHSSVEQRNIKQRQELEEIQAGIPLNLIQTIRSSGVLISCVLLVAGREEVSLPPLDTLSEESLPRIYSFVKTNYDAISKELLQRNEKTILNSLASALGMMEKGRREA
ncbi:CCHC-type zinc finger, nucleic acid binding protein a isoform X1 [Balamuthia mandrillaris]